MGRLGREGGGVKKGGTTPFRVMYHRGHGWVKKRDTSYISPFIAVANQVVLIPKKKID